jgi:hypothetical protein
MSFVKLYSAFQEIHISKYITLLITRTVNLLQRYYTTYFIKVKYFFKKNISNILCWWRRLDVAIKHYIIDRVFVIDCVCMCLSVCVCLCVWYGSKYIYSTVWIFILISVESRIVSFIFYIFYCWYCSGFVTVVILKWLCCFDYFEDW